MQTHQLCYISEATRCLSKPELSTLLEGAKVKNKRLGITGFLFYDTGNFFQFLEGPEDSLALLMTSLSNDDRHRNLEVVFRQPGSKRFFNSWSMAGFETQKSFIVAKQVVKEINVSAGSKPLDFLNLVKIANCFITV